MLAQTKAFLSQFVLQKDVLMGELRYGGGVVQSQGLLGKLHFVHTIKFH